MKIIQRTEMGEPQPAIDTLCDNCGAIYDLFDCSTCLCGKVLCPDCSCENTSKNTIKPGIKAHLLQVVVGSHQAYK